MNSTAPSIGDGYEDYLQDELGYTYEAWDVTDIAEMRAHDELLEAPPQGLVDLPEHGVSDLLKWAAARASRRAGTSADFYDLCEQIMASNTPHPAIAYDEICMVYAEAAARLGDSVRAERGLVRYQELRPQGDPSIEVLRGRIYLLGGDVDNAEATFSELGTRYGEDVDLRIDFAEDLLESGAFSQAERWIDEAEELATRLDDTANLVDIALLRAHLEQARGAMEEGPPY